MLFVPLCCVVVVVGVGVMDNYIAVNAMFVVCVYDCGVGVMIAVDVVVMYTVTYGDDIVILW